MPVLEYLFLLYSDIERELQYLVMERSKLLQYYYKGFGMVLSLTYDYCITRICKARDAVTMGFCFFAYNMPILVFKGQIEYYACSKQATDWSA